MPKYGLQFAKEVRNPDCVRFDSLSPGDVFEEQNCLYMVLERGSRFNAVNIACEGQLYYFTKEASVLPRKFMLEAY